MMSVEIVSQNAITVTAGEKKLLERVEQRGGLKYLRGNVYIPTGGTLTVEHKNFRGTIVDVTETSRTTAGGLTFNVLVVSNFVDIFLTNTTATAYSTDFEIIAEYED